MPEITVGVSTFRRGGIDVLFNSLAQQPFRDYELVLVDELYEWRKREVAEYAEKLGIPLVHVPPKRREGSHRVGISNGVNTIFAHARSDTILFLTDYQWVGRETLERHVEFQRKHRDAVVTGLVHRCAHPKLGDLDGKITVFAEEVRRAPRRVIRWSDKAPRLVGVRRHRATYVGDNTSFPLEAALRLNGFDERFDVGHGFEDTDFFARMRFAGYEFYCDTHNEVYEVDHSFFPTHEERPNPNRALYTRNIDEIALGRRPLRAPNPFDLYKLRDAVALSRSVDPRWRAEVAVGLLASRGERNPAQLARLGWLVLNAEQPVLNVGCRDIDLGGVNLDIVVQKVQNFVQGRAEDLPFGDKSFKTVVIAEILEHVEDPQKVLEEAKRVGETILITVPWEQKWAKCYSPFKFGQHRRFYTRGLLDYELRRAGITNYSYDHIDMAGYAFHLVRAEVGR